MPAIVAGQQGLRVQAILAEGRIMPDVRKVAPVTLPMNLTAPASVRVEIVVSAQGTLAHARVIEAFGADALSQAVMDALQKFEFRPAIRGDRPATTLALLELAIGPSPAGPAMPRATIGPVSLAPLRDDPAIWRTAYRSTTSGLSFPRAVREVNPMYTAEAMKAKIVGSVELDVVILEDGTVGTARVTKTLDATHGLDRQALVSARHWFFKPAMLNGRPVPVRVALVLEFQLH
jgi:TonB family protein